MLSFFGEPCLKDALVRRVAEHQRLDQFIQKVYWDGERGCSIGCALHTNDHMAFERELGLPVFLAYMVEDIYEALPLDEAKFWTLRWVEAVPVGVDLKLLFHRFVHRLLSDPEGMRKHANQQTLPIIEALVSMYARRIEGILFDAEAAWAAWAAAEAARAVAWAAGSAGFAGGAGAAGAVRAVRAAEAVRAAAGAARAAAEAAGAAEAARAAAWSAVTHRQADYLITLLHSYEPKPILVYAPCAKAYFEKNFEPI